MGQPSRGEPVVQHPGSFKNLIHMVPATADRSGKSMLEELILFSTPRESNKKMKIKDRREGYHNNYT